MFFFSVETLLGEPIGENPVFLKCDVEANEEISLKKQNSIL
jgi:hypothetical protein